MAARMAGITAFHVTIRFSIAIAVAALAACGGGGGGGASEPSGTSIVTPTSGSTGTSAATTQVDTNPGTQVSPGAIPTPAPVPITGPGLVAREPVVANSTTAGDQSVRSIAALTANGHGVAWLSQDSTGTANLFMRRFDPTGAPAASETRLNYSVGPQENPAVTVLADGSAIVASVAARAVSGADPSTVNWVVFKQRFESNGAAAGAETEVASLLENQYAAREQRFLASPSVLALDDGSYVVGWASVVQSYVGKVQALHLQRYDATGARSGAQVDFPAAGSEANLSLKLIAVPGGKYIAATTHRWMGHIYIVYHVPGGADIGPVNDPNFGLEEFTTTLVPLTDGRFALWARNGGGPYIQTFDASGLPLQTPATVGALPEVAVAISNGGYVTLTRPSQVDPLVAQRFDAAGAPVGDPIQITTGGSRPIAVRMITEGFALAWTSPGAQSDTDVTTQRIDEAGATTTP